MAVNASEWSISSGGDIRHVSGTAVVPVLDMHAWLQDLADNQNASADDNVYIAQPNPSELAGKRDALVAARMTLLNWPARSIGYNIDDTAAQYLNFGSVSQGDGAVQYSGLRTIGAIVAASPMFLLQNGSKISKFWGAGHIQVMVKVKSGGAFVDSGKVTASSRKFGQTFTDFEVDLTPGGEVAAAVPTSVLSWVTLTEGQAAALSTKCALTVADASYDLGNGAGARPYKGKLTLSNGCTLAQAMQYAHYLCREDSAATIGGVPGWRFQRLDMSYAQDGESPIGRMAGSTAILARGWWIEGVLPGEAKNYILTDANGVQQLPPNVIGITVGNLLIGDNVFVTRDDGGAPLLSEYTLTANYTAGATAIAVTPAIKADTPSAGTVRIGGKRYAYSSWSGSTFDLAAGLGENRSAGTAAYVPFLDRIASGSTESVTFVKATDFTAFVTIAQGADPLPIKRFESTFAVGDGGGAVNAVRIPEK